MCKVNGLTLYYFIVVIIADIPVILLKIGIPRVLRIVHSIAIIIAFPVHRFPLADAVLSAVPLVGVTAPVPPAILATSFHLYLTSIPCIF
ncbi:MAG: hypothetical protein CVV30_06330 [Methanomicrobiales archaeon HGW-Methanomicrobiales-1]|nr:MAG: hypothetical protein CVV30_06330 [Methanomicrobiales archaeon HGW-Methanomicrobiales-1]